VGHGSGLYRGCGIKGFRILDAYAAEQTGHDKVCINRPHVGEGVLIRKVSC